MEKLEKFPKLKSSAISKQHRSLGDNEEFRAYQPGDDIRSIEQVSPPAAFPVVIGNGLAGHSYGAGAIPALSLRAVQEGGWGSNGLALLLLAPWYSYFVTDAQLASFPAGTQAVVQVYEDDAINDHRMAVDIFTRLELPDDDKDYLMIRSDRIDGYNYDTSHRVPTGAGAPGEDAVLNALDAWGVFRVAQALGASAWENDPAARAVALGNGSREQTMMGSAPGGRALRPMVQTDRPIPLFPSSRYIQPWDGSLNPRADRVLPEPTSLPHLANISARARSSGASKSWRIWSGVASLVTATVRISSAGLPSRTASST